MTDANQQFSLKTYQGAKSDAIPVQSSLLLSAYLTYMRDVGSKEFNLGVMSDDDIKALFDLSLSY